LKRISVWFVLGYILLGCGRLITPTVEPITKVETVVPTETIAPSATPQPTSTPRKATPFASPTPTITPTPIIYSVQSGDTLLKIAIQFDRSTEAIQEANGIVDPRFLQIGQRLIIPPKEDSDELPTPTPTPPPLEVTSINFRKSPQGILWFLGTVKNPGDEFLTGVVIEASLFDRKGILLSREAAFTQLDVIEPGKTAPFAILFDTPPSDFAQYQVTAVAGVPLSEQARYYFELETFDLRGSAVGLATFLISGQLRNWGTEDVETIRLVAVAYDQEDRVLAQRQAELAVTLLRAGSTTPFEIELNVPHGRVDRYEVLAQGLRVE